MAFFLDHEVEELRKAFPEEEATLKDDFSSEELTAINELEILKDSASNYLSEYLRYPQISWYLSSSLYQILITFLRFINKIFSRRTQE